MPKKLRYNTQEIKQFGEEGAYENADNEDVHKNATGGLFQTQNGVAGTKKNKRGRQNKRNAGGDRKPCGRTYTEHNMMNNAMERARL